MQCEQCILFPNLYLQALPSWSQEHKIFSCLVLFRLVESKDAGIISLHFFATLIKSRTLKNHIYDIKYHSTGHLIAKNIDKQDFVPFTSIQRIIPSFMLFLTVPWLSNKWHFVNKQRGIYPLPLLPGPQLNCVGQKNITYEI